MVVFLIHIYMFIYMWLRSKMKHISIEQNGKIVIITTYKSYIDKVEKITANSIRIELE